LAGGCQGARAGRACEGLPSAEQLRSITLQAGQAGYATEPLLVALRQPRSAAAAARAAAATSSGTVARKTTTVSTFEPSSDRMFA
jgi:hypothetical protein